jgi:hypothetical protein
MKRVDNREKEYRRITVIYLDFYTSDPITGLCR